MGGGERKQPLGEMLVEAGVITSQELKVALESQRQVPAPLGVTLVELGIAREQDILPILQRQLNRVDAALAVDGKGPELVSVTDALQQILTDAVEAGATDIHFEPHQSDLKIRVRIDGVLREMGAPRVLKTHYAAAVSSVKVMCNMDIAEKRMPQEGRTSIVAGEREFDLRVSVLPSHFGESVVARVIQSDNPRKLGDLGLEEKTLQALERCLLRRSGLILVCGPTGSGKTNTLYACLDRLNDSERKIVTIEDPIEYTMPGAIQMQVNAQIDLTFGRMLRTVLRHDPNVIMVGEIRDVETAEIAIRSSLTGHLVLSTIHTPDSTSTIARLLEMGIEPYLVSSALTCSLAQRLVRTTCARCKGKRCMACLGTGLKGRTGIFECLVMDDGIRELTLSRSAAEEIRQYARTHGGMTTLYEAGMAKVKAGVTTQEEVERVVHSDELG